MSYNKLPKEKLKSLLLFWPIFLSAVLWISGELDFKKAAIVMAVYILSVLLNVKNMYFMLDRIRFFRILVLRIGLDLKKRLVFLMAGFLLLLFLDSRVNFLYQIVYIALFVSTDTYIGYIGEKYRQMFGKE
jgi:hypothetical protein